MERAGARWFVKGFHSAISFLQILTCHPFSYPLSLKLFDTCVTQTVLWCCESWTLTQVEKQKLRTVQNDMLRRMVGPRRGAEEDWVDWIKRSTRAARKIAEDAGIRFWVEAQVQKKWSWVGHVSRMAADRFAKKAATWRDSFFGGPLNKRCRLRIVSNDRIGPGGSDGKTSYADLRPRIWEECLGKTLLNVGVPGNRTRRSL